MLGACTDITVRRYEFSGVTFQFVSEEVTHVWTIPECDTGQTAPTNQPPVAGFCMYSYGYVDDLYVEGDTLPVDDPVPGEEFSEFVSLWGSCGRFSDPDGQVVLLEWFLDDQLISTKEDVDWPVTDLPDGVSEIRLRVTDDRGATAEAVGFLERIGPG